MSEAAEALEFEIRGPQVTYKSAAWGHKEWEVHEVCQRAIREAVRDSPDAVRLREWLGEKRRLSLSVEFYLGPHRAAQSDLDSLISSLMNPLVEGAAGSLPKGKPIPQTRDALFWHVALRKHKVSDEEQKIVIRVRPLAA